MFTNVSRLPGTAAVIFLRHLIPPSAFPPLSSFPDLVTSPRMSDPVVQVHPLLPRSHTLTFTTPFVQSQCTGGYLCGTAFQQNGCYATPDYSTCHFDASLGLSTCTVCICNGYDNGETGCDTSSSGGSGSGGGGTTVYVQPSPTNSGGQSDLFTGVSSKRFVSKKLLVGFASFCVLSTTTAVFGMF